MSGIQDLKSNVTHVDSLVYYDKFHYSLIKILRVSFRWDWQEASRPSNAGKIGEHGKEMLGVKTEV